MAKGLGKHSFLESVEGYENRGVNFVRFVAKSEGAEIGRAPSKLRVKGREGGWRGRNINNGSTKVTDCQ
jgi:hypothetical protein